MELKEVLIRSAQPVDAAVVAQLMYYASSPFLLAIFGKPESYVIGVLRRVYRLPYHRLSYTYAFVAEAESEVVGLLLGFDGKAWDAAKRADWIIGPLWFFIARPWRIHRMSRVGIAMDKMSVPISEEEYYIEQLAVLPERRSQGIGKKLIEFVESQALAKGLKRVTLDVEIENEAARRLYERMGFQTIKVVTDPAYCKRFDFQGSIRMAKYI